MSITEVMPNFSNITIDSGRYKLLHQLGSGSFGVVYRARERLPNSHRVVDRAIKVMPLTDSKSYRKAQHREAALHKRVSEHPNVVTLRRIVQDEYYMYCIMDFCGGGDLYHAIGRQDVFPRNGALVKHLFLQILDGVDACHKKSVYHRDLKPENILLSSDYTHAYIADFGLASESTRSLSFNTGSRYYMSPECVSRKPKQRRNAAVHDEPRYPYDTSRSDVWALGMILFTLVTGRLPWLEATIDDPAFLAFLSNATFRETFPISAGLDALFRAVFTAAPHDSIGLATLRETVVDMGSFWMAPEEVAASNAVVQFAYHAYQKRAPRLKSRAPRALRRAPAPPPPVSDSDSDSDDASSVESDLMADCARIAEELELVVVPRPRLVRTKAKAHESSSDDGPGPVTPVTRPQDATDVVIAEPLDAPNPNSNTGVEVKHTQKARHFLRWVRPEAGARPSKTFSA